MAERAGRETVRELGLNLFALAGLFGGLSCGGGDIQAPATGSIEINTITSGPEPDADGYAVSIDDQAEKSLGINATLDREGLEPGSHSVRLMGMAANCNVAGDNPRTVSVPAGESTPVIFEVTCSATTGSLEITASTTGASVDPDGYTVSLDGSERGVLATNSSVTVGGLIAGNHAAGLGGVAANCQVQGDNPREVTVVAGASVTVAFAVICAAPPAVTGSIRITVSTTGPEQDVNGYAVALDGGASQPIGVNATTTLANVSTGAHTVRLSGAAGNCTVGGTNPRSATVAAGATAEVSFAITCTATTGSVEITTITRGAKPDPDGYTVTVDQGNSQTVGPSATIAVPTLAPGSHAVGLAGIAPNCRVEGENPRSVTITVGQKATTTFSVLCPTFGAYRATELSRGLAPWQSSIAYDINSAGQVVGTTVGEVDHFPFFWENGVMTDLGDVFTPYDWSAEAAAINSGGQVVGSADNSGPGGQSAWLWDRGVLTILEPDDHYSRANDVNAAGQVVGVYESRAALWESGSRIDLGTLGGTRSAAFGIDPAGRVVGGSDRATGEPHAFLWENGVMTDLNIPGNASTARSINATGQVVGTVSRNGVTHGFLWEKGATIDLGEVLDVDDINAAGQVVGTREVKGMRHAFIWEQGVTTDLPGPSAALGINDEGQVVGSLVVGRRRGWATLWTPE